jgi:predicted SAM-dependent methyltransferase
VNLDLEPVVDGAVAWDMRHRLPLENGSVALIHNEHFLEHLTPVEAFRFLSECRRVLTPDGVLRIAMPDLHELVRHYWEDDWRNLPVIKVRHMEWIKTRAEWINVGFRAWGHQWLYDRDELHRRLGDAGFRRVKDVGRHISEHIPLRNLETRDESTLICEASP